MAVNVYAETGGEVVGRGEKSFYIVKVEMTQSGSQWTMNFH
jgi:hypothetical protein